MQKQFNKISKEYLIKALEDWYKSQIDILKNDTDTIETELLDIIDKATDNKLKLYR